MEITSINNNSFSKLEEDIRKYINKFDLYSFINRCIEYYTNNVVDLDLTKNRIARLSSKGLSILFLTKSKVITIPMDWVCISYKLEKRFSNWVASEFHHSKTDAQLWNIIRIVILYFKKDELHRTELKTNLDLYIETLINYGGSDLANNWAEENLQMILSPICIENLLTMETTFI